MHNIIYNIYIMHTTTIRGVYRFWLAGERNRTRFRHMFFLPELGFHPTARVLTQLGCLFSPQFSHSDRLAGSTRLVCVLDLDVEQQPRGY